ncbi:MAG: 3-carboxy-cis,cis-muconate cycloisomerase [Proteobacteria bacterium]|nr:3-carboxy-cis,cis-muconate cycloisomerase [Pseudomonadota bacterium]
METLLPSSLLLPLFASAAMRAVVDDRARIQRMLDFEAALARAESALGIIPTDAAIAIADACKVERFDIAALASAAATAGNVLDPLVEALTAQVAASSPDAARFVHWGATSQDVIDTALVLELRAGIDVLLAHLDKAVDGFLALAGRYRRTPTVARTRLQQALPMPFGLKAAGYAAALARSRERLRRLRKEALLLQFGGAAGTLAALEERGFDVMERLGALIDLPPPDAPWHSHRDRLAEVACALAILAGSCGKIARDVSLMMQSEVSEAFEPAPPGRGGAAAMGQRRDPVGCAAALATATIAPQLAASILAAQNGEYERSLGAWQSEWMTFPALLLVVSGALAPIVDIAEGLEIDNERMRANLDITHGAFLAEAAVTALAEKIGKPAAHAIVEEACQSAKTSKLHLQLVLMEDKRVTEHLAPGTIARIFEPMTYQGVSQLFIERLVASAQGRMARRTGP